jgi:hypothetical protein
VETSWPIVRGGPTSRQARGFRACLTRLGNTVVQLVRQARDFRGMLRAFEVPNKNMFAKVRAEF